MKHKILTTTIGLSLIIGAISACNSSAKKVENAQENVTEANNNLDVATKEYQEDVAAYKKLNNERIEANNLSIADFNSRIALQKKEAKEDYNLKIAELEKKNTDLKLKLDNYKDEGKTNWENFKTEFNRDMDDLGESFKNLTTKNNSK